ncbi:apolipoprotein N-acyltransferase [Arcanobacterium ihumii]|uniref:apolipoprotein N-acyltransferase n=1 Tax=Arcanobacterium ihumii TaxID=2138162 RepID=UPI000F5276D0|nr:apolipoprotein N-acyltransferase [Arcanobacterium ihumii]
MNFPRKYGFLASLLFSLGAGGLLYCAAPPLNLWLLGIIGIALLWLLSTGGVFSRFCCGVLSGFTYFYLLFDWATIASKTELARVALALSQSIFIGLLLVIWTLWHRLVNRSSRHQAIILSVTLILDAFAWVLVEQCRSSFPFGGMPWGTLAFSLVDSPLINLASFGSTQLVGFCAVLSAVLIAQAFVSLTRLRFFTVITTAVTAVALILAPTFIGQYALPTGEVKVGVVQGNVPDEEKLGPKQSRALIVTQNHADVTSKIVRDKPDLIIWPESSSDRDIRSDSEAKAILDAVLEETTGTPMLLGTQKYMGTTRTNDVLAIENSEVVGTYSKQHPVPFGEYLPWRSFIEKIVPEAKKISVDMVSGDSPAYLSVKTANGVVRAAVPICFEVAYTSIVSEGAKNANLLVVPTNNASFGYSGEPLQQLAMTRFRAVELRKSAIQASTSGTSAVVSARGVVRYQSDLFEQAAKTINVPLYETLTFAVRSAKIRETGIFIAGIAMIIAMFGISLRNRQRNR